MKRPYRPGNCTALIKGLTEADIREAMEQVQEATGVVFTAEEQQGMLTLEATGVQAHASTPDEGKNAITAMLELLTRIPLEEDK